MAELAETRRAPDAPDIARAARGDPEPLPAATVDTADCRPGGYEHPRSHMYRTYRSKQRNKQHLCVGFSEACDDCNCCESAGGANVGAYVGTAGNIGEQASTASRHNNGSSNGAKLTAIVGSVATGDFRGNCNALSNGAIGSNNTSFPDSDFPK